LKPYLLRIMAPGTIEKIAEDIPSDTPFAISVGDLVNLETYSRATGLPGLLRIIGLEHKWIETKLAGTLHRTMAFTEEVPDTTGTRMGTNGGAHRRRTGREHKQARAPSGKDADGRRP
jgi:hypothetical protein